MRYTLTDKAIAILLSLVLLAGVASASAPISSLNDGTQVDITNSDGTAENVEEGSQGENQPDNGMGNGNENDGEDGNTDGIGNDNDVDDVDDVDNEGNESEGEGSEVEADKDDLSKEDVTGGDSGFEQISELQEIVPFDTPFRVHYRHTGSAGSTGLAANYSSAGQEAVGGNVFNYFDVPAGTTVTFTATSTLGKVQTWGISGGSWSDGGTPEDMTASVVVNAPITVTVTFHRPTVTLTFGTNMDGATATSNTTPIASGGGAQSGSTIAINAPAASDGQFVLWKLSYGSVIGEVLQSATGSNSASFLMPAHDTTVFREFLPGRQVTFSALADASSLAVGAPTYTWSGQGGTHDVADTGAIANAVRGVVPDGATVTFTAPSAPGGFTTYGYEWKVNGSPVGSVSTSKTTHEIPNISADTTVEVRLVPGYEVKWNIDRGGELAVTGEYGGASLGDLEYADDVGVVVPGGATLTLTASPPNGFHVFAYRWDVNNSGSPGEKLHNVVGANTITHTVSADATFDVKLVRGHYLTFGSTGSIAGTVTAGFSTATTGINPNDFLREDSSVTFEATPPAGVQVFAYTWYVNNALQTGENNPTFTVNPLSGIDPITDTINVEVSFVQGYAVTFATAGDNHDKGEISAVATLGGLPVDNFDSGSIVEDGTLVVFTAAINDPSGDGKVYRVEKWTVGGVVHEVGGNTFVGDELTLTINAGTSVLVYFEEVTLELNPAEVTVKGHGVDYIFGNTGDPGSVIEVGGKATGAIEFSTDGSTWTSTITVVSGLTLSASGDEITVDSRSPLSSAANVGSPYTVTVRREGVTETLTINVVLPYFEIVKVGDDDVSSNPATMSINNGNIDEGVTITVETNATNVAGANGVSVDGLLALPGVFDYKITNAAQIDSGSREGDLRLTILIYGDRQEISTAASGSSDVSVRHVSGVSDSLKINYNLTPPPRIDKIEFVGGYSIDAPDTEVEFDFENVSVHGSLGAATTPPSSVYAEFKVTGVNLSGVNKENEGEVHDSLKINVPAWITGVAIEDVEFDNDNENATVTVKLTITANKEGTPEDYSEEGRPGTVALITDLTNQPSEEIRGEFPVIQHGKITLEPDEVSISNYALTADVDVGGWGEITLDKSNLDDLNGRLTVGFHSTIENRIVITGYRPTEQEGDIVNQTVTVGVTRDGLTETLSIIINLTSLDRPQVVWPAGMTATFGDLVGSVSVSDAAGSGLPTAPLGNGVGYAHFTREGETEPVRVPGAFEWVTPGNYVGPVGEQEHQMRFVPADGSTYATMITGEGAITLPNPKITVSKATPHIIWPDNLSATYGQTLNDVTVSDSSETDVPTEPVGSGVGYATFTRGDNTTMRVPGVFAWVSPSTSVGDVIGSPRDHGMTFTPTDSATFESGLGSVGVTVGKKEQLAPSAPTVESKAAVSVTLVAITSETTVEYGISAVDGSEPVTWQTSSTTFNNLLPNRTYTFFARLQGDDNHYASPASTGTSETTNKATLAGTPTISGTLEFGYTLEANTGGLYALEVGNTQAGRDALGALTYKWQQVEDGSGNEINPPQAIGSASAYTIVATDIGMKLNVVVEAANAEPPAESAPTAQVKKRTPVAGDFSFDETPVTYTGAPQSVTVTGKAGMGTISWEYKLVSNGSWSSAAPTNAGVYQIRVNAPEGDTYLEAVHLVLSDVFEIGKAMPTEDDLDVDLPGTPGQNSEGQNEEHYYIKWSADFATTPPAAMVDWAGEAGVGVITVEYLGSSGGWSEVVPTSPGTYQVKVNIAEGVNYEAASFEVGTFVIEGIEILDSDIIATSITEIYDGETYSISVSDAWAGGTSDIRYSLTEGGSYGDNIGFRNATSGDVTVYFRVTRPGTGFEDYYGFATVNITQRQLNWNVGSSGTPASVQDKDYDGNQTAAVANLPTLSQGGENGVVAGDTVTVSAGSASFASKDAATGIAVNASGWGITGTGVGNYITPAAQPAFANADIGKKQLTWDVGTDLNRATANNKDYDGGTTATASTAPTLNGVVVKEGVAEDVTVSAGSLNFEQSSVGTWSVTASGGWGITGDDVKNYNAPTSQPLFNSANIGKKQLTWNVGSLGNLASVSDKVYDRTTSASVSKTPTLDGVVVSETVNVKGGDVSFAQPDVGTWVVTASDWGIEDGAHSVNYAAPAAQPLFSNASITEFSISGATVTVHGEYVYRGTAHTPSGDDMAVTVKIGGVDVTLVSGTDYEIDASYETGGYKDNIDAGTATVGIKGKGNFKDGAAGDFTIERQEISGTLTIAATSGLGVNDSIVAGTVITADISSVIGVPPNGEVIAGTDIEYSWYRDGVLIDSATGNTYTVGALSVDPLDTKITARVSGIGNFSGELSSNFIEIGKTSLSGSVSILPVGDAVLGQTLTLDKSLIEPEEAVITDSLGFTWLRNGVAMPGKTGETYLVTQDDLGTTLKVIVEGKRDYTGTLDAEKEVPAIPPYAPLGFAAMAGDRKVELSWTAPFDGGSPIIRYELSVNDGSWGDIGLVTNYTVTGLTNKTPYTFKVRAVNGATPGEGAPATATATPFAPPVVISIKPSDGTVALFADVISFEGVEVNAVFDVVGTDLTEAAVLAEGAFWVAEFPAWVKHSNLTVDFDEDYDYKATVTVTLEVAKSTEGARSGNVVVKNAITSGIPDNPLALMQGAAPLSLMTIVNYPNEGSVPVGQTASGSFYQGTKVSVSAGTRSGYVFGNWSCGSEGIDFESEYSANTSFTMPGNAVIITANWVEYIEPEPGPRPTPDPAPDPDTTPTPTPPSTPDTRPTPSSDAEQGSTPRPGQPPTPEPNPGSTPEPSPGLEPTPTPDPTLPPTLAPDPMPPEGDDGSTSWLRNNLETLWISLLLLAFLAYVAIAIWCFRVWLKRRRERVKELDDS